MPAGRWHGPGQLPWLLLAMLVTGVLGTAQASAQDPNADLTQLRERIHAIEAMLRKDRRQRDSTQADLATIETRLAPVNKRLRELRGSAVRLSGELRALGQSLDTASAELQAARTLLGRQLRSAYAAGRDAGLRTLLNQADPARTARLWGYHRILGEARSAQIQAVQRSRERMQRLRGQIEARRAQLARERQAAELVAAELQSARADRAAVLKSLQSQLSRGDRQLKQLRANEQRLLGLIESLQRAIVDVPDNALETRRFQARAGQLAWPVRGSVLARFGSARAPQLRWDGILIAARAGTPVQAVAHGRVAFADWLRGYGLLVILDHGDGYMSLYGHNESLSKAVGDWVEPGEVLAHVGDSGGQRRTALYFGLRQNGRPADPRRWLARRASG